MREHERYEILLTPSLGQKRYKVKTVIGVNDESQGTSTVRDYIQRTLYCMSLEEAFVAIRKWREKDLKTMDA